MLLAVFCLELSPTAYAVFKTRVLHKAVSHEKTRFSHRERERKKVKLSGNFMVNFEGKNFVSIASFRNVMLNRLNISYIT